MDFSDLFKTSVTVTVAVTIPFYVAGYFPPEYNGDKHPPHDHSELSSGSTATGNVSASSGFAAVAVVTSVSTGPRFFTLGPS